MFLSEVCLRFYLTISQYGNIYGISVGNWPYQGLRNCQSQMFSQPCQ